MSKKNKLNLKSEQTSEDSVSETPQVAEVIQGVRGEIGQATASLTIRQMWHATHFTRHDVGDKHNPRKRVWTRNHGAPSLKRFARELIKSNDTVAKDWFANKAGAHNQERSEANRSRVALEKQATRQAKRKNSKGGGKSEGSSTVTTVKK